MALFKKKADKEKEKAAKAAEQNKGTANALSIKNVKAPTKASPAEPKAEPTKKAAPAKTATKTAAKTPAKAAPKAAEKAPATKTAAKAPAKAPAKKASAAKPAPVTKAPASVTVRPFFTPTEDDIRLAFDQAIKEADYAILKNGAKAIGKYEFELAVDGYHFYLVANNGQMLFDSPSFTTLLGALGGIKTFKKAVEGGNFEVKVDKYNRYRFILDRKYYGENYDTKDRCVKCVESVKNFADNAKIIRYTPDKEAIRLYETAKNSKRTPEDVDWKAVERAEAQAAKMGKFEICREDAEHYCFYLLANNGQILYASRYYASESAARKGVDSFKRAAYVGNFFVDRDKFGNYRYVLKNIGSAPSFMGESYDNKAQCERIIDSVKNFIVSASIEIVNA